MEIEQKIDTKRIIINQTKLVGNNKKLWDTVITLNSRLLIGVFISQLKFQLKKFYLLFGILNILGFYKLFGQNEIENFFSVTN